MHFLAGGGWEMFLRRVSLEDEKCFWDKFLCWGCGRVSWHEWTWLCLFAKVWTCLLAPFHEGITLLKVWTHYTSLKALNTTPDVAYICPCVGHLVDRVFFSLCALTSMHVDWILSRAAGYLYHASVGSGFSTYNFPYLITLSFKISSCLTWTYLVIFCHIHKLNAQYYAMFISSQASESKSPGRWVMSLLGVFI